MALNRAVAIAMRDGAEAGLAALDALLADGELDNYQLAHAARADFCRRLGRHEEARQAYQRAIKLTAQGPARRFLERRLAALPCLTSPVRCENSRARAVETSHAHSTIPGARDVRAHLRRPP